MNMPKLAGLFILDRDAYQLVYGEQEREEIRRRVNIIAPQQTRQSVMAVPELLAEVDVIFGGWGGPLLDQSFLDAAPRLKAYFHGAGSLASHLTNAVWERHLAITSALHANGRPVAEYALAAILFSLKHGWRLERQTRQQRRYPDRNDVPGAYGSTIGLISLGTIARSLIELLRPFDLRVIVYDPFLTAQEADELRVETVSLPELFERADVVSLHAPNLPETRGMIDASHFKSMRRNAVFINTARGEIVRQQDLLAVARLRSDLQFVLDVTDPDPLPSDSPLFDLENVVVTPHIAGSAGAECARMGKAMVDELDLFLAGKPMQWQISAEAIQFSSHRPHCSVPCSSRVTPI